MKSLAAILAQHGQPLVIDEVEYGEPLTDQVLVKLFASGICHSQLHQIHEVGVLSSSNHTSARSRTGLHCSHSIRLHRILRYVQSPACRCRGRTGKQVSTLSPAVLFGMFSAFDHCNHTYSFI